jgi:hypothetical protein
MTRWVYFGCHKQPGHYCFAEGMGTLPFGAPERNLTRFDGALPPQDDATPYIATVSRLGGWGMTALAFWDYSVDGRGGCNSVVFAPSLEIGADELLAEAQRRFPQVFGRLPKAVVLKAHNAGGKPLSETKSD